MLRVQALSQVFWPLFLSQQVVINRVDEFLRLQEFCVSKELGRGSFPVFLTESLIRQPNVF